MNRGASDLMQGQPHQMQAMPKKLNTRQGSVLVLSYFLVATMLGLVMPQTMRSLNNVTVARRTVDNAQLYHYAEAGADRALKLVKDVPDFGSSLKAPTAANAPYACANPGNPPAWCYGPAPLPNAAGTFSVRATDVCSTVNGAPGVCAVGKELIGGSWGVRRYLVVTTTLTKGTVPTDDDSVSQHDIVIDVLRRPGSTNPKGSVFATDQVIVGSGAKLYGDIVSQGGGAKAVILRQRATVQGKIKAGRAGGALQPSQYPVVSSDPVLCCQTSDAIRVARNATVLNDSGSIIASENVVNAPNDPMAPSWRTDASLMNMLYANNPTPTVDPVHEMPPRPCVPGGIISIAQDVVQDFSTGTNVSNGWKEYCFDSLRLYQNAVARFVGDKVRIVVRNPVPAGGGMANKWALITGKSTKVYSVRSTQPADAPLDPRNPAAELTKLKALEVDVSDLNSSSVPGVRLMSQSKLYGSIYAPKSTVMLGARSEEVDPPADDDPPLVVGDEEYDPDSEVTMGGFVIGKIVQLRSRATLDMNIATDSSKGEGEFDGIRVRAWRSRRIK